MAGLIPYSFIRYLILGVSAFFLIVQRGQAQESGSGKTPETLTARNERLLIGIKWRYTYTLHVPSATIVHQADEAYDFYLHFRYDNTYEQFLNGILTRGPWQINGHALDYPYKSVRTYTIAEISNRILALEFEQPNSNGRYRYYYKSVDAGESPFPPAPGELPEVVVKGKVFQYKKQPWWKVFRRNNPSPATQIPPPIPISIELIGGGYYGGMDLVQKDFIIIRSDGRLIKEYQTVQKGLTVTKKNIPREELERFAAFIQSQRFFEMDRLYDCHTQMCLRRKRQEPTPIPLRLMVTYGDLKKVVTVSIWGEDNRHVRYVDYPPALDLIVDAIQRMAHRLEEPETKKAKAGKSQVKGPRSRIP